MSFDALSQFNFGRYHALTQGIRTIKTFIEYKRAVANKFTTT